MGHSHDFGAPSNRVKEQWRGVIAVLMMSSYSAPQGLSTLIASH